jgi:hypothetical protein
LEAGAVPLLVTLIVYAASSPGRIMSGPSTTFTIESGGIPQTFGVPAPPHTSGNVQFPQKTVSGHVPSVSGPQFAPTAVQVLGVQQEPFGRLPGGALALLMQTPPQQL